MTMHTPVLQTSVNFSIFNLHVTREMLKLCRVTKVKVFFLVLVYVFNFDLFEFSVAILDKGLLIRCVFSGLYCCYGNLCCKNDNVFTSSWAVFRSHDCRIKLKIVILCTIKISVLC